MTAFTMTNEHARDKKIDGKTFMGNREATHAEHAQHTEAGYYVARLKGGSKLHLRKAGEDAICGARPTRSGAFRQSASASERNTRKA